MPHSLQAYHPHTLPTCIRPIHMHMLHSLPSLPLSINPLFFHLHTCTHTHTHMCNGNLFHRDNVCHYLPQISHGSTLLFCSSSDQIKYSGERGAHTLFSTQTYRTTHTTTLLCLINRNLIKHNDLPTRCVCCKVSLTPHTLRVHPPWGQQ